MASQPIYFLQIVDKDGKVAHLPGGGDLEVNLIDLCTQVIMSKGVGFFRNEAHVEADIRAGLAEALMGLKQQTLHLV